MDKQPWYHTDFFSYGMYTFLVLLIVFLIYQVAFLLTPILNFISSIFAPIVISLLFYYLLRPIVYRLEEWNIPRIVSIIMIYMVIGVSIAAFFAYVSPLLARQIESIANSSVETLNLVRQKTESLFGSTRLNLEQEVQGRIFAFVQGASTIISQNLLDIVGFLTHLAAVLAVIPFIVFYLLKDDNDFSYHFLRWVPEDFAKEVKKILRNIDTTLASYITGLVIISTSVGALLYVGYLIIGLGSALLLSLMAVVFMTIPFLGPFLALMPALMVGFSQGSVMVLKVLVVFIIAQQLEGNIISPQVIGQRLHIHPLTIILLLLAAGTLYGLVGLLLATPAYAVAKVLVENFYKIYRLRYAQFAREKEAQALEVQQENS